MKPLLKVEGLKKYYPLYGQHAGEGKVASWLRNRVTNVSAMVPTLHAVDGVSFDISAGESLGLVGESGCGKTTLVSMLARLSDVSAGQITYQEADISGIPADRFHARIERTDIQIVFQDPHESLNPRFTAYDTIAEPIKRLLGIKNGTKLREKVAEVASQVGLPEQLLSRFPHQLSGGQKARVNIARAICVSPKLLILDEPTSALDVSVQVVILKLLVRLKEDLGMSYLFVSHDLNVVRLLCDRVIVMYLGQIVESGPTEKVFSEPGHPYTKALIAAIPGGRQGPSVQRETHLEGEPKSPIDPDPNACRLCGRCPIETDHCARIAPEIHSFEDDHLVRCHLV